MPPSSRRALLAALPPLAAPSVLRAQGTVRAVVSFPPGDGVARLSAVAPLEGIGAEEA